MFKLDLLQDDLSVLDVSNDIESILDEACIQQSKEDYAERGSGKGDVAYNRIGAGYVGLDCIRHLAYKYHRVAPDLIESVVSDGELKRHAAAGFWTEEYVAKMLAKGGFDLKRFKSGDKQYNWLDAKMPNGQYALAGEVDGVVFGHNLKSESEVTKILDLGYPVIWESKKMTAKKFAKFSGVSDKTGKELSSKGVKSADYKYFAQCQMNMAYLPEIKDVPFEYRAVLFTALNLDTMKPYAELIKFDVAVAQSLTDRAVSVIQSKSPDEFPRLYEQRPTKGLYSCRFCEYQKQCWGV